MLKAGAARIKITPPVGIPLAGFGAKVEVSKGVHDDLEAKALVLKDEEEKVAIITLDLVELKAEIVAKIREKIKQQTGIKDQNILICCTHTHSGPDFKPNKLSTMSIKKQELLIKIFTLDLIRQITHVVDIANSMLKEARVSFGKVQLNGLSYNRRMKIPGGVCNLIMSTEEMPLAVKQQYESWGILQTESEIVAIPSIPLETIDPDVSVVKIYDLLGNTIAILVNFACHPTVLGPDNYLISADYCGYMVSLVEEITNTIVMFTQGAAGDIRPYYSERSFKETRRVGTILASAVIKAIEIAEPLASNKLKVISEKVELPLRKLPSPEEARKIIADNEKVMAMMRKRGKLSGIGKIEAETLLLRRIIEDITLPVQWLGVGLNQRKEPYYLKYLRFTKEEKEKEKEIAELQVIAIGDILLVAIPGEVFHQLGLNIKKKVWTNKVIIISLANGSIGYIFPKEAYEEGGYEIFESRLAPNAGDN
jgi:hypothetical protein